MCVFGISGHGDLFDGFDRGAIAKPVNRNIKLIKWPKFTIRAVSLLFDFPTLCSD
jgi:hypothetical protein